MNPARRRCLLVGLLATVAVGAVASPAGADHAWANYHWARTTSSFTLSLGNNLSGDWPSYLSTTSTDWSQSVVLDTVVAAGTTSAKRCAASAGRVEVCNSTYGRNGWLGVAQIWLTGDHITQGTVKVNDTYFKLAPYTSPAWKNHVMCQEVGHTLGLDHQDESGASLGTCMDYSKDPTASQHPNDHDYYELELIYDHTDSFSTVAGSGAAASAAGSGATAAELHRQDDWGRAIRFTADGRPILFERDLGGGRKLFTWVTWAQ